MEYNSTLKVLCLSHNTFGDIGTQALGRSLKFNKGLTKLDLTANSIVPKAAVVLANSLCTNDTLRVLILDGNILGKLGAQALIGCMQRSVKEVQSLKISFQSCDCQTEDHSIFDASSPAGKYKLNLSEPYGQMVIDECFFLANSR